MTITHSDMLAALSKAQQKSSELQARLRKAAVELVGEYLDSLKPEVGDAKDYVSTAEMINDLCDRKPVAGIKLSHDKTLRFIIITAMDPPLSKFVVSVSIVMRARDETLSITVDGDSLPIIVLGEGTEGRFYEVAEIIKCVILTKIERLA